MRFTLIYNGSIPSQGDKSQKDAIRNLLQQQLKELHSVTSPSFSTHNQMILGGVRYISIIPIDWTVRIRLTLLRTTAVVGRMGNSDLDNVVKTVFDSISAPHGYVGQPSTTPVTETKYCALLEDNQISNYEIIEDFHWAAKPHEDLAVITVFTRETEIDEKVALGGESYRAFRQNVF